MIRWENGWGEGYTFPCLFKNSDKGWILISETGVNSYYCGSRLMGHEDGLYTIGFRRKVNLTAMARFLRELHCRVRLLGVL